MPHNAFGAFDGEVGHQPSGRLQAETVNYPPVEAFVDRDVVNKPYTLVASSLSSEVIPD